MKESEINVIKLFEEYDLIKESKSSTWQVVDEELHTLYKEKERENIHKVTDYIEGLRTLMGFLAKEIQLLIKKQEDMYSSLSKVNHAFKKINTMNYKIFDDCRASEIPEIYLYIMNVKCREKVKSEEFPVLQDDISISEYFDGKMLEYYYELYRQKRAVIIKQQCINNYLQNVEFDKMNKTDLYKKCIEIDNESVMNELSTKFRCARKSQGLTQAELSERSKVCRTMIAQIESKNQPMKMETAIRLASCLHMQITIHDLLPLQKLITDTEDDNEGNSKIDTYQTKSSRHPNREIESKKMDEQSIRRNAYV